MPGKLAPGRPGDAAAAAVPVRPAAAGPVRKELWTVDASLPAAAPAPGAAELDSAAVTAVRAGGGHVLDSSHVVFPNGAVTLVLILAESHLAIHTWPEENLIAVDLFSCGAIDAERVAGELVTALRLTDARVRRVERGAAGR